MTNLFKTYETTTTITGYRYIVPDIFVCEAVGCFTGDIRINYDQGCYHRGENEFIHIYVCDKLVYTRSSFYDAIDDITDRLVKVCMKRDAEFKEIFENISHKCKTNILSVKDDKFEISFSVTVSQES